MLRGGLATTTRWMAARARRTCWTSRMARRGITFTLVQSAAITAISQRNSRSRKQRQLHEHGRRHWYEPQMTPSREALATTSFAAVAVTTPQWRCRQRPVGPLGCDGRRHVHVGTERCRNACESQRGRSRHRHVQQLRRRHRRQLQRHTDRQRFERSRFVAVAVTTPSTVLVGNDILVGGAGVDHADRWHRQRHVPVPGRRS